MFERKNGLNDVHDCTGDISTMRTIWEGHKIIVFPIIKCYIWDTKSNTFILKNMYKDIVKQVFTTNPYAIYLANKIINGHQMNVVWNVEDIEIYQKIPQEVSMMIEDLK